MDGISIVGNCQYSALISKTGNVNWLCWPRFDSSFVFGGLLDSDKGGVFAVEPAEGGEGRQSYLTNTNILRTRFQTEDGVFDVIDFAPRYVRGDVYHKPIMLVRIIEPVEGNPLVRVRCQPTGDYGRMDLPAILGGDDIIFRNGRHQYTLMTDLPRSYILEERAVVLTRRQYLVFAYGETSASGPLRNRCEDMLDGTIAYWRRWVKHCHLPEHFQSQIVRSALVLKLHQFEDTGAIIAASTTSIPEAPNSSRNWDYRYCWLRDSYFTIQALMRLSHFEELEGFERFLRNTLRKHWGRVYPMYTITGEHEIPETELPKLKGYKGHQPVRIGNAASMQVQNDAYGQALLALTPLFTDVRFLEDDIKRTPELVEWLLEGMERAIAQPDAGIWEFRGVERPHSFTSLMHWAGACAAARAGKRLKNDALYRRANSLAKRAEEHLWNECWDEKLGSFVIAPGEKEVDASMLLAINLGFMRDQKARASRMIDVIRTELNTPIGLIQRYRLMDDGFGETTACFTVCSFWLAEALALVGRVDEAIDVFEKAISYSNQTGLLSEDIDPTTGEQWGNFPQTYSHVGVVNAAFAINTAMQSDDVNPILKSRWA